MKNIICRLILCVISFPVFALAPVQAQQGDTAFYAAAKKWFTAWELVSKRIYGIDKVRPVDFVFFDGSHVYSTAATTMRSGQPVKGPDLLNLKLLWNKELHHDTLTLPDGSVVPVGLMSFAGSVSGESGKPFFVMPLPVFWREAGVSSKELGIDNLITGVFLHEFSHTQQMQNFGKRMTAFEQQNNFGGEFSDDIVQHLFSKDTAYLDLYRKEVGLFYASVKNTTIDRRLVLEGLATMKHRQDKYFIGELGNLKQIDNFFLTMEGLGQYTMFLWLTHPAGAGIKRELAIEGVRRGRKWWSQDEGFALFLILDGLTLSKTWVHEMFGEKTETVADLIQNSLYESR